MLKLLFLSNKYDDCKVEGHEKLRLFVIYLQEFRQEIPLPEDHNYGHFYVFGQTRKLQSHLHYHRKSFCTRLGWIFLMFESRLSWSCRIFERGRSDKSLGKNYYCGHEAIKRLLEPLLCKVLLSFVNSKLIECSCIPSVLQIRVWAASIICNLARRHLITRYFCLLFSDKRAHFLTKNHSVDFLLRLGCW